ncbi:MAG TPA: MBL fold metallo-hydrolase [Methanobacteriaceae archaeon]|nr:MBL fold metallo-hydrolase [Methanobacteriaceae archaeon]
MKKWTTKGGCTIYQLLSGRGNSYLVKSANDSFLVDTGSKNSLKKLERKLDELTNEELSYLVLTHTHYDHTENAAWIREKYGAKIIVQKNEVKYLEKGDSPIPQGTMLVTKVLVAVGRKLKRISRYPHVNPDLVVDDEYQLDSNCRIIHTPGHTAGSISVIVDDEIALVGDAMFGIFWGIFPPFADDVPVMIRSWGKLLETNCRVFLPGHGSEDSRELVEKEYARFKDK